MKRALHLLLAIATLGFVPAARASFGNVYVSESGNLINSGANCSAAKTAAWFSDASNWGGGGTQIGLDTVVHLCGTFNGSVGQVLLTVQGSGASGHPITIKFEPGARLTSPHFAENGAIHNGPDPISYIVIDGGTACGRINGIRVECNGVIENTDTGTVPDRTYGGESTGIYFRFCNHCVVKNLAVSNIWVKTANGDEQGGGDSIHVDGDDVQIINNIVHDSFECIASGWKGSQTSTNKEFANNIVYNCNFGMAAGNYGDNAILTGFKIHDNESYDWSNWDNPVVDGVGNHFHHNGVILQWQGGEFGTINNLEIYNNYFHGNTGGLMTGEVFIDCEQGSGGCAPGMLVYNNVFVAGADGQVPDNGMFVAGASAYTIALYNNTFAFTSKIMGGKCANWTNPLVTRQNNIFLNCDLVSYDVNATMAASDYNVFWDFTNMGPGLENTSLAAWQSATGFDGHSMNADPGINLTTFAPTSNASTVVKRGANLVSLGVTPLLSDRNGTTRVSSPTAWDVGAQDYVPLTGAPRTSYSRPNFPFGNVPVSTTSGFLTVSVTNVGDATLHLTNIVLGGTDAAHFTLRTSSPATCGTSATLAPSLSCDFDVSFSPVAPISYSATVTVTSDSNTNPDVLALTGSGASTVTHTPRTPVLIITGVN